MLNPGHFLLVIVDEGDSVQAASMSARHMHGKRRESVDNQAVHEDIR